mgnify:CR=1 FL=1
MLLATPLVAGLSQALRDTPADVLVLSAGTALVGASIGVAFGEPDSSLRADELVSRADAAMYEQKRSRSRRCHTVPSLPVSAVDADV